MSEDVLRQVEPAISIVVPIPPTIFSLKALNTTAIPCTNSSLISGENLPASVGEVLVGDIRVLRQGPFEWMLVSQCQPAMEVMEALQEACAREGLVVVDLSDALAMLRIAGPQARELLTSSCGLDLHADAFPLHASARTRLARITATIDYRDERPLFDVYVDRSHLQYLRVWLADAAGEVSLEEHAPASVAAPVAANPPLPNV